MTEFKLGDITRVLKYLDRRYKSIEQSRRYSTDTQNRLLLVYSRSAVMEAGSWIESSLDRMLENNARSSGMGSVRLEYFEKQVKGVFGFKYKKHLLRLVQILYALSDKPIASFNNDPRRKPNKSVLKNQLDTLWDLRCKAAHDYSLRIYPSFPTPSTILNDVRSIQPSLKEFEKIVKEHL